MATTLIKASMNPDVVSEAYQILTVLAMDMRERGYYFYADTVTDVIAELFVEVDA